MSEDEIADELVALIDSGRSTTPFSARTTGLDLKAAYRIAAAVRTRRETRGDRVVGRKIGFTNRTLWQRYGVHAPFWNYVWASTAHDLTKEVGAFKMSHLSEPRIEPEIMFGVKRSPAPSMTTTELADCVEWVAHGFEIVQSVFPQWKFTAPDAAAAYGLHGMLLVGAKRTVMVPGDWVAPLDRFRLSLFCNGTKVDEGSASNILGGPLHALRHLVEVIAADGTPPLQPGEIITTGTVTDAFPVVAGQSWHTEIEGIDLEGARVTFA